MDGYGWYDYTPAPEGFWKKLSTCWLTRVLYSRYISIFVGYYSWYQYIPILSHIIHSSRAILADLPLFRVIILWPLAAIANY